MKIEHTALNVTDPVAMAEWYVAHLGMKVVRSGGGPAHARFLADSSGSVMLELYRNEAAPVLEYGAMDPLMLHIAWVSDDVAGDRARLLLAGATGEGDVQALASGDKVAMLRDPWGLALQLVHRAKPMLRQD